MIARTLVDPNLVVRDPRGERTCDRDPNGERTRGLSGERTRSPLQARGGGAPPLGRRRRPRLQLRKLMAFLINDDTYEFDKRVHEVCRHRGVQLHRGAKQEAHVRGARCRHAVHGHVPAVRAAGREHAGDPRRHGKAGGVVVRQCGGIECARPAVVRVQAADAEWLAQALRLLEAAVGCADDRAAVCESDEIVIHSSRL